MFVKYIEVSSCYGLRCQCVTLHRNPASRPVWAAMNTVWNCSYCLLIGDAAQTGSRLQTKQRKESVLLRLSNMGFCPEICSQWLRFIMQFLGDQLPPLRVLALQTSQALKLFQEHLFHPFELFNNWLDFIKYVCGIAAIICSCTNAEKKKFPSDSTCWSRFFILKESYQIVLDHQVCLPSAPAHPTISPSCPFHAPSHATPLPSHLKGAHLPKKKHIFMCFAPALFTLETQVFHALCSQEAYYNNIIITLN